jgi:hypothetical protein
MYQTSLKNDKIFNIVYDVFDFGTSVDCIFNNEFKNWVQDKKWSYHFPPRSYENYDSEYISDDGITYLDSNELILVFENKNDAIEFKLLWG